MILDTVVRALAADKSRTFTYVEQVPGSGGEGGVELWVIPIELDDGTIFTGNLYIWW